MSLTGDGFDRSKKGSGSMSSCGAFRVEGATRGRGRGRGVRGRARTGRDRTARAS
jgi:hypothetical protein